MAAYSRLAPLQLRTLPAPVSLSVIVSLFSVF